MKEKKTTAKSRAAASGRGAKDRIYFTRAYRRLPIPGIVSSAFLVVFILALLFLVIWFRSELSYIVAWSAWKTATVMGADARLTSVDFLWAPLYCVDTLAVYPSRLMVLISLIISVAGVVILPFIKKLPAPANYWFFYILFVQLISSLFFVFFAPYLPYTIWDYTSLYAKVLLVMWLVIPVIDGLSVAAYPTPFWHKMLLAIVTLVYSIVFGAIRGALNIVILESGSVMMMAFCFFILGALLDFVYVTGFFGYFMANTAKDLARRKTVWKWLY